MRILKYLALLLLLAVFAVYAIGASLPEKYSVKRSVYLPGVMVIDLWDTLLDMENAPKWNPAVKKVELIPNPKKRSYPVFRCHGNGMVMDLELVTLEEYQKLSSSIINSEELGFGGEWVFELRAEPTGTRLTITENGFVKNPLWRFMSHKIMGTDTHVTAYLQALARHKAPAATVTIENMDSK